MVNGQPSFPVVFTSCEVMPAKMLTKFALVNTELQSKILSNYLWLINFTLKYSVIVTLILSQHCDCNRKIMGLIRANNYQQDRNKILEGDISLLIVIFSQH